MPVQYPVAANAEAALSAPLGRAAREREARDLAAAAVEFRIEETGPAFATREAALDAYAGRIRDDRPGRGEPAPEDNYLTLREVVARKGGRMPMRAPVKPTFKDGHRWPQPEQEALPTVWRASIAYWRLVGQDEVAPGQARSVRKTEQGPVLGRDVLADLTRQPLRPVKPQQPLDIGLFEAPLPEAPGRFIPDE
jgi:hypothetical protein